MIISCRTEPFNGTRKFFGIFHATVKKTIQENELKSLKQFKEGWLNKSPLEKFIFLQESASLLLELLGATCQRSGPGWFVTLISAIFRFRLLLRAIFLWLQFFFFFIIMWYLQPVVQLTNKIYTHFFDSAADFSYPGTKRKEPSIFGEMSTPIVCTKAQVNE